MEYRQRKKYTTSPFKTVKKRKRKWLIYKIQKTILPSYIIHTPQNVPRFFLRSSKIVKIVTNCHFYDNILNETKKKENLRESISLNNVRKKSLKKNLHQKRLGNNLYVTRQRESTSKVNRLIPFYSFSVACTSSRVPKIQLLGQILQSIYMYQFIY